MAVKGVNYHIKGTNLAGPAVRQFHTQLQGIRTQMGALRPVTSSWNRGLSENRRAIQQLGFQMTDFSVQIAGGQNAMLAFVQQGGQMLQVFGPMGAILAAVLTGIGTLAFIITKSGMAISELTPLLGVLRDELGFVVTAFRIATDVIIWVVNLILNNLDVLATVGLIYLGRLAFAAILASNVFRLLVWSIALVGPVQTALTVGTWALTAAMAALRAVMLTVLPIALLVGVAWLIVKFIELIQLAGGFGNAMGYLGDLVQAVFWFMAQAGIAFFSGVKAGVYSLVGAFMRVFEWILAKWEGLINSMISGWNTVMETFGLEGAMGSPFKSDWLAAAGASAEGFAEKSKGLAGEAMDAWSKGASGVADAWGKMKSLFDKKDAVDVRDWFGGGSEKIPGGGGGKSPAMEKLSEEAKEIKRTFEDVAKAIESSLMTGFKAVIKGTKSLKDYAIDVLDTILDKTIELLMQPIFAGIASKITGSIFGILGLPSFAGGGYTGNGSRSGGLDGKGGYMAMLHPQESVIDHTLGGSGGGSAGGVVHVYVHESPSFASTVDARAEGVAVRVVRGGLAEYDRRVLPRSASRINNDPMVR